METECYFVTTIQIKALLHLIPVTACTGSKVPLRERFSAPLSLDVPSAVLGAITAPCTFYPAPRRPQTAKRGELWPVIWSGL